METGNRVKENVGRIQVGAYGMGNFACQLSFTMVNMYLAYFYTDVFGLSAAAVATLLLVAKVWDGINDPMMGALMDKTYTRVGGYRTYMIAGAVALVLFTILTFSVPGFGDSGKLFYAYVTYIGLGMAYTVMNVPFNALPSRMTDNPKRLNQLFASSMWAGGLGSTVLGMCTMPLILMLGNGVQEAGYQKTAIVYAVVSLPMVLLMVRLCKENPDIAKAKEITAAKEGEKGTSFFGFIKSIFTNKNLLCVYVYMFCAMFSQIGRASTAFYYYMFCVGNMAWASVLMSVSGLVGLVLIPFVPALIGKYGKKKVVIVSQIIQIIGLIMMFAGPYTNIPYTIAANLVYGLGGGYSACVGAMIVDALDNYEYRTGVRNDGVAFAFNGLMTKISAAIAGSIGLMVMAAFGYTNGADLTERALTGINTGVNIVPLVAAAAAIVPMLLFDLNEEKMTVIRQTLKERRETILKGQ
ncbi:MFS transporter [Schaedlerella arabinosiphila]|jgi:sugar (glycoside-pentoside-hexuronide) transporter|uniref:MFS transporter n=1 Tax=Schaedlerella arabinosiphila TaxID=2044587 RepID=A0A9X5CCZ7_9FIRM|nr:glycoside-pentoside-hexuronide (GPH):cation symporter [Schaedlerella arabinosiphila]KAI4439823.1 Isoprimeverose transporter [Schaedlerella arabinosiphila]NBJ01547.1 MFS transporter [Lachnospiraceae bacterium]NDO72257.1 MFS transporter [Schaedlerella arabinosiphila]